MKYPHWIVSGVTASLLLVNPLLTHAEDGLTEPVSFLVSLQDDAGNHICNGTYIGDSHILTHANCKQSAIVLPPLEPFPPIVVTPVPGSLASAQNSQVAEQMSAAMSTVQGAPVQASTIQAAQGIGISFPLNGDPTQAVFLLPGGDSAPIPLVRDVFISKRDIHPVTGNEQIFTLSSVPEEAVAITLADEAFTNQLLQDVNTSFTLIGKYIENSPIVTRQNHDVSDDCFIYGNDKYRRSLCFSPSPSRPCSWDAKATGAPLFATSSDGRQVLMGFKPSLFCPLSTNLHTYTGQVFTASSSLIQWANLQALKHQGLDVVSAYEFGTFKKHSHHELNITFVNKSESQRFDLENFNMRDGQAMTVKNNDCGILLPSETCSLTLHTRVPEALNYLEELSFSAQGLDAGIFVSLDGYQDRKISGDSSSTWRVSGWKSSGSHGHHSKLRHNRHGGTLYSNTGLSEQPSLIRNEYVDGPTKIHVTYRTEGTNSFVLGTSTQRKSLKATPGGFFLGNVMPGTSGEWLTYTLEIKELGRYQVSLSQFALSIVGQPTEDIAVSKICIGECGE